MDHRGRRLDLVGPLSPAAQNGSQGVVMEGIAARTGLVEVVAFGDRHMIPTSENTHVAAVLRETLDLSMRYLKGISGDIAAALFLDGQPVPLDTAIDTLPRRAVLYLHGNTEHGTPLVRDRRALSIVPPLTLSHLQNPRVTATLQPAVENGIVIGFTMRSDYPAFPLTERQATAIATGGTTGSYDQTTILGGMTDPNTELNRTNFLLSPTPSGWSHQMPPGQPSATTAALSSIGPGFLVLSPFGMQSQTPKHSLPHRSLQGAAAARTMSTPAVLPSQWPVLTANGGSSSVVGEATWEHVSVGRPSLLARSLQPMAVSTPMIRVDSIGAVSTPMSVMEERHSRINESDDEYVLVHIRLPCEMADGEAATSIAPGINITRSVEVEEEEEWEVPLHNTSLTNPTAADRVGGGNNSSTGNAPVELAEGSGRLPAVQAPSTTSSIATHRPYAYRKIRIERSFPLAALRELLVVPADHRLYCRGRLVKNEQVTFAGLRVAPHTILYFQLPTDVDQQNRGEVAPKKQTNPHIGAAAAALSGVSTDSPVSLPASSGSLPVVGPPHVAAAAVKEPAKQKDRRSTRTVRDRIDAFNKGTVTNNSSGDADGLATDPAGRYGVEGREQVVTSVVGKGSGKGETGATDGGGPPTAAGEAAVPRSSPSPTGSDGITGTPTSGRPVRLLSPDALRKTQAWKKKVGAESERPQGGASEGEITTSTSDETTERLSGDRVDGGTPWKTQRVKSAGRRSTCVVTSVEHMQAVEEALPRTDSYSPLSNTQGGSMSSKPSRLNKLTRIASEAASSMRRRIKSADKSKRSTSVGNDRFAVAHAGPMASEIAPGSTTAVSADTDGVTAASQSRQQATPRDSTPWPQSNSPAGADEATQRTNWSLPYVQRTMTPASPDRLSRTTPFSVRNHSSPGSPVCGEEPGGGTSAVEDEVAVVYDGEDTNEIQRVVSWVGNSTDDADQWLDAEEVEDSYAAAIASAAMEAKQKKMKSKLGDRSGSKKKQKKKSNGNTTLPLAATEVSQKAPDHVVNESGTTRLPPLVPRVVRRTSIRNNSAIEVNYRSQSTDEELNRVSDLHLQMNGNNRNNDNVASSHVPVPLTPQESPPPTSILISPSPELRKRNLSNLQRGWRGSDCATPIQSQSSPVPSGGSGESAHRIRITIKDPEDPTRMHYNVPVDPNCPVGILREWITAMRHPPEKPDVTRPNLMDRKEYGIYCGSSYLKDDGSTTFGDITSGKNDSIFSIIRL